MLFPDPCVDIAALDSASCNIKRSHLLCSHCHKEIVGKVHRSGNKYYDTYCWYMRYVLELEGSESDRQGERRVAKREMEDS